MPGMMRSPVTGWRCDRASQRTDWQRREWTQADKHRPWQGDARRPDYWPQGLDRLAEDYLSFGYWPVESEDDEWMYGPVSSALTGDANG
ncbi:hypothetical protein [Nocardia nova]|uniref:hypothetical protein n=1 Tax=Nocardia nova TaxID=37330 RepID=UPI0018931DBF|nr:hypothetical protein [Nocardia nova]MBF6277026.1 hypothetical protein [Nocardia nova]